MASDIFQAYVDNYITEMEQVAASHPDTGAASVAAGFALWRNAFATLSANKDADGKKLYHNNRQAVTFPLADALCPLLAARLFILDVLELEAKGPENAIVAEGLPGYLAFFTDLARIQSAKAAGEAARVCANLVHGYAVPGADLSAFDGLRAGLDKTLTGLGAARERAGESLCAVMPALQKAKPAKPDLAAIDYRGVSLPTQKRETRIVKDTPVDVIAQEIIDWIAS